MDTGALGLERSGHGGGLGGKDEEGGAWPICSLWLELLEMEVAFTEPGRQEFPVLPAWMEEANN